MVDGMRPSNTEALTRRVSITAITDTEAAGYFARRSSENLRTRPGSQANRQVVRGAPKSVRQAMKPLHAPRVLRSTTARCRMMALDSD